MKHTKKTIVKLLSANGGLTTGELSGILGISATAVRRHLNALEAKSIVKYKVEQRGMGRPSFVYEMIDSVPAVFSQSFAAYVASMLTELEDRDPDTSAREIIERRGVGRHQKYIELTEGQTLNDRVACLARLMESEGRIATWQQLDENSFILREHNCPFHRLNGRSEHPCRREVSLLKKTLQADVKRVDHIIQGDVACVYRIECKGNGNNCQKKEESVGRNGRRATADTDRQEASR